MKLYESEIDEETYISLFNIGREELIQNWKDYLAKVEL